MLKSTLHVLAKLFDGIIKCDPKESVVLQDLCFNLLLKATTPASNLGYLAPPQDNFSWVPNCLLGPPGWETKVSSKKFWFGLCEIAWFLCQPIANLRRGVCL